MTAEAVLPFEEFVADGAPAPATPAVGTPMSSKKSDNPGYVNLTENIEDVKGSCSLSSKKRKRETRKSSVPLANISAVTKPPIFELGSDEFARRSRALDKRGMVYKLLKRAFDIAFSLLVIVVCLFFWPITLGALIVTAVSTKGTPLYTQKRIGKYGKPFHILKLRTMVADSDDIERYFTPEQLSQWRKERKVDNDPRITKFGAICRKISIDEIFQFLNCLIGQMSIIGPRPIVCDELSNFSELEKSEILSVRPGITGWWQVSARNDATWEDGSRQELELYYVRNASFSMDARVFVSTFGAMFGKRRTGR